MTAAADDSDELNRLVDRLMALLHGGQLPDDGTLYQPLATFITGRLDQAVTLGWHAADPKLRGLLKLNVTKFSGFKTYAVQKAMREKLTDDEGQVRPFADFRTDALAVHQLYNVRYLETEYNQAVAAGQMASKWAEFTPGALLRYETANDDRVRTDHKAYDNKVLPMEHPFWQKHYPPCDWACRCTVVEVDDDTPITPASELRGLPEVPEEFQPNVGVSGEIYGPEHSYFDVPGKVAKQIDAQLLPVAVREDTPQPPNARPLPPKVAKFIESRLDKRQASILTELQRENPRESADTLLEFFNQVEAQVQAVLNDAVSQVRIGGMASITEQQQTLRSILQDRFKTQFETNFSGGVLSTAKRAATEKSLFGYPDNLPAPQRPVYGFLSGMRGHTGNTSSYGRFVLRLHPNVLERTTFAGGDTLSGRFLAAPAKQPRLAALLPKKVSRLTLHLRELRQASRLDDLIVYEPYLETQIHGGLTAADISGLYVEDLSDVPADIQALCQRLHIPIEIKR